MLISILTLFPEIFLPLFLSSIIGRAQKNKLIEIKLINIRDFAADKHKSVDDRPYGGGAGMILRVDILEKAIEKAKHQFNAPNPPLKLRGGGGGVTQKVVLLDPKGKLFNQKIAQQYSKLDHLILVCGHYEGVDERVKHFVNEKISIGEYILTGGEIPAMVVTDALARLIPNVLSKKEATLFESFSDKNILEEPQYTRPPIYKDYKVPEILLSGNHSAIEAWRFKKRRLLK